MAVKTYYLDPANTTVDGNFAKLSETTTGIEVTTATGWTVGTTAPTAYDEMARGTEASGGFGAGALPDTTLVAGSASDSFRTENPLSGTFAATAWAFDAKVIAVTAGGDQDGRLRWRVFKSANANGSGATELTAATLLGGAVTNLTTSAAQNSNATWSPGSVTLTNEYLFFSLAWEITGAGAHSTRDVLLRKGETILITTPDFTSSATNHDVTVNDSVTMSDAVPLDFQKVIADSVTPSDAVALTESKVIDDSVTATDAAPSIEIGRNATVNDSITTSDAVSFEAQVVVADSATPSDALALEEQKVIADTVALADAADAVLPGAVTVDDTVTVADAAPTVERGLNVTINDTLGGAAGAAAPMTYLIRSGRWARRMDTSGKMHLEL